MNNGQGYRMMFLGFFGTWWIIVGCLGYYGPSIPMLAVAALAGVSIVMAGWVLRARRAVEQIAAIPDGVERQRRFRNINIAQWTAIIILIVALNVTGYTKWMNPGIIMIVGLHFVPLARLFGSRLNLITGCALIAIAVASPVFGDGGPASPAVPLLAGVLLWGSALIGCSAVARQGRLEA
jgi:hypothetical protein